MKKWIGSVLFLGLMTSGYAQCEQLVWSDEFDSPSIDLDNWSFEIGDDIQEDLAPVLANGESVTNAYKLLRDMIIFTSNRI